MIVKELLNKVKPEEIINYLAQKNNVDKVMLKYNVIKLIHQLNKMKPIENKDFILFVEKEYDYDFEKYFDVILFDKKELLKINKKEEILNNITNYGIDFVSREEVLGYQVSELSIDLYGEIVVMSEIIDEITFYGWEEETVQRKEQEIENIINNLDKHSKIEKSEALEIKEIEQEIKDIQKIVDINKENREYLLISYIKKYLKKE